MPNLQVVTFYESPEAAAAEATEEAMPAAETIRAGRMHIADLPTWPHAGTDVYLCGPVPFMQTQWRDLIGAGVPASRLHREVFGPELLDVLA